MSSFSEDHRLLDALKSLDPANPVVALIRPGPGCSAAVPLAVELVECGGALELTGNVEGPGPADAMWCDIVFDLPEAQLWSMQGGRFDCVYPPAAFRSMARTITPGLPVPPSRGGAHTIRLGSRHGRSSDGDLPFFLVTDPSGECGVWFAPAHSGNWAAELEKAADEPAHRLRIWGAGSGVVLMRSESLTLPTVVMAPFRGDGWAAVREYLTRRARRPLSLPVVYNTWFNEDSDVTAESCLNSIKVAAEVGVDYLVVDAGYYGGLGSAFDGPGLGTFAVDPTKFPDGLEVISDASHTAGLGFGLWVEPERAHPESLVATTYPRAMRAADGLAARLVDFGHPEIRDWAFDLVRGMVERYRLDWLKWDFNIDDPNRYWNGDERAELAHYRGVYDVIDRIRDRFPDLIYEHVSSGGNRLDVAFLTRADIAPLSDQTQSPDIVRGHLSGASRVLPARFRGTGLSPQRVWAAAGGTERAASLDPAYSREWLLSCAAGATGFYEPIALWTDRTRRAVAGHVEQFKRIRHVLDGEFLRFSDPVDGGRPGWEAWEFTSPAGDEAILFAFRQGSAELKREFHGRHDWAVELEPHGATLLEKGVRD